MKDTPSRPTLRGRSGVALSALLVAAGVVCCSRPLPAAVETTAALVEKAKARQEKVKSFDVRLRQTEVQAPGAASSLFSWHPAAKPGTRVPSERTTLTSENRLVVQGNNFRYEDKHPTWHMPQGTLVRPTGIFVSNGEVAKTYFPNGLSGDRGARGVIEPYGWHSRGTAAVYAPLMMAFRGLEPTLAPLDVRRVKPGKVTQPVGGVTCSQFQLGSSLIRQTLWADESGLMRRLRFEKRGVPSMQYDIRYESRYGLEAFPVSWVMVQFAPDGSVRSETTVEVVEAVVNPTVPRTEFEVTFPPGCRVADNKHGGKEYLVQSDGSMRELDRYGEFTGETRPQDERGFLSRHRVPVGIALVALLIVSLGGYAVFRRRRNA